MQYRTYKQATLFWTPFLLAALIFTACDGSVSDSEAKADYGVLTRVSFFQSIEVPVLSGGSEIKSNTRNAPIVAGKESVLRVLFELTPGAENGALTLEVEMDNNGSVQTYSAVATAGFDPVSVAESGLMTSLPKTDMQTGTRFSATLYSGAEVIGRFPEFGRTHVGAVETGILKIRFLPFTVNGFTPDTSTAIMDGLADALLAVYPVTQIQYDVADAEVWSGAFDLGDINVRVGEIQEQAMFAGQASWDTYYYGLVTGVATRDEYTGITGTSESGGDSPNRAYFAAGAAFGDQRAEDTLIHEMGHVHGLLHTPCDGEDNIDPDYPYSDGTIGIEGYDFRTGSFIAPDTMDMMTYCYPRWISDYGYAKIAEHVIAAQNYSSPE